VVVIVAGVASNRVIAAVGQVNTVVVIVAGVASNRVIAAAEQANTVAVIVAGVASNRVIAAVGQVNTAVVGRTISRFIAINKNIFNTTPTICSSNCNNTFFN